MAFLFASAAAPQSFTITARVYDQAGVPNRTLKRAEAEASKVAVKSGFAIEWVNCAREALCRDSLGPNELAMLVRGGGMQSAGTALLETSRTGVYAIIYYNPIRRTAAIKPVSAEVLLGHVMAHEMGHLLGLRHTPGGVMNGNWRVQELIFMSQGGLRFSASECRQMQTELGARFRSAKPEGPFGATVSIAGKK